MSHFTFQTFLNSFRKKQCQENLGTSVNLLKSSFIHCLTRWISSRNWLNFLLLTVILVLTSRWHRSIKLFPCASQPATLVTFTVQFLTWKVEKGKYEELMKCSGRATDFGPESCRFNTPPCPHVIRPWTRYVGLCISNFLELLLRLLLRLIVNEFLAKTWA